MERCDVRLLFYPALLLKMDIYLLSAAQNIGGVAGFPYQGFKTWGEFGTCLSEMFAKALSLILRESGVGAWY